MAVAAAAEPEPGTEAPVAVDDKPWTIISTEAGKIKMPSEKSIWRAHENIRRSIIRLNDNCLSLDEKEQAKVELKVNTMWVEQVFYLREIAKREAPKVEKKKKKKKKSVVEIVAAAVARPWAPKRKAMRKRAPAAPVVAEVTTRSASGNESDSELEGPPSKRARTSEHPMDTK